MWLILACANPPQVDSDTAEVLSGLPDPSAYDCTARSTPIRTSAVPFACGADVTCPDLLVSGHRGMGGELGVLVPENTVSGVRAAIAYGVDFVETDPRPTADDVLVNLHDSDVSRVTDGEGEAADLTYDEIMAMSLDVEGYPGDFSCERVATLNEILTAAKGQVHVLVDANKTDRVDLLVQAILDTATVEEAIFDTSSPDKIAAALLIEPTLQTMIRVEDTTQLQEQLALFAEHPPVVVEIDDPADGLADAVRAAGHRSMVDVFLEDAAAGYSGDLSLYTAVYDEGLIILESDRPELVLQSLGR